VSGVSGLYIGEIDGWSVSASGFPNDMGKGAHWSFVASDGTRMVAAKAPPAINDRELAFAAARGELRGQIEAALNPDPERWWWWAGDAETVDAEGMYEHGEAATREGVITEILPHLDEGQVFVVIEAQFGGGGADGCDEFVPFKASRNQEFLMKRDGLAVPAPAEDAVA